MEQVLYRDPFESVPRRRARPVEKGRDPYDGLRPWSAITHGVGAALAVLATIALLARSASQGKWLVFGLGAVLGVAATAVLVTAAAWAGDVWKIVSFAIYGLSMTALYTASTLYHCVNTTVKGRVALRKLDHASIYFLIAGSYTPVCLTALRGAWGWTLFGIIWALAIAGLVMSLTWINCPRAVTSTVYIAMGWVAVFALYPLWQAIGPRGIAWLLAGGVLYTVGGVLYAVKWPGRDNPRFGCHEIFHIFILLGSIAHFILMAQVVLRL